MKIESMKVVNNNKIILINDFTYDFKKNNVYFLIGKNGCGKSSLLRKIYSKYLLTDNNKKMSFLESEISAPLRRLTTKQYISQYYKNSKELIRDLKIFSINEELLEKPFINLSEGQKRSIQILSIFKEDPDVYLMDEPSSSLDKKNLMNFENMIKKSKDKIFIIATHNFSFINSIKSKTLLIKDQNCQNINTPKTKILFETLIGKRGGGIDVEFNFD